jgi:hypothetical protein
MPSPSAPDAHDTPSRGPLDAFEALGLKPSMDITAAEIREAFLARVSSAAAPWQRAQLNSAKQTLLDAEARANLLHARFGGQPASVDRTLPEGFLMQMLERREAAQHAMDSKDQPAIDAFLAWADAQRQQHLAALRPLLMPGASDAALRAARAQLNAWRYIQRMIQQLTDEA